MTAEASRIRAISQLAVFIVAMSVAASVAGKILAEGFIFVSDARQ
jgi:archaellum component FlaG (FlaF/FlaG flagellin family)